MWKLENQAHLSMIISLNMYSVRTVHSCFAELNNTQENVYGGAGRIILFSHFRQNE